MRNIQIKVSLEELSKNLNLNDVADLALIIQNVNFSKYTKKDSIEHILTTIKNQLIHGENFNLINSNDFILFILKKYIDTRIDIKKEISEENKQLYISILEISKLLENYSLKKDFKKFIIEESKNQYGYNFNAIQNYVYEEYNEFKQDFEKIIMEKK